MPPPDPIYREDPTLPTGTIKQVDWEVYGATVIAYRTVSRNGEVFINDTIRTVYAAWPAGYNYGPGTDIPYENLVQPVVRKPQAILESLVNVRKWSETIYRQLRITVGKKNAFERYGKIQAMALPELKLVRNGECRDQSRVVVCYVAQFVLKEKVSLSISKRPG